MKKVVSILILLTVCIYGNAKHKKKTLKQKAITITSVLVTIHITQTQSYCGGVAHRPETVKALRTPKPVANATYYITKDATVTNTTKVISTVTSNIDGTILLKLPIGKYYLLSSKQITPLVIPANDEYHTYKPDCLKEKWQTPLLELDVTTSNKTFTYNEHQNCPYQIDCCSYTGPLPQ